jgi:predicted HTH transcriptional regulator
MLNDDRQRSLFDITSNRHGGNEQSTEARHSIDASEIRKRVLDYIKQVGDAGVTCDELEQILELSHQTASARCSELKEQKLVDVRGTRKTRSGRNAGVLIARRDVNFWRNEEEK